MESGDSAFTSMFSSASIGDGVAARAHPFGTGSGSSLWGSEAREQATSAADNAPDSLSGSAQVTTGDLLLRCIENGIQASTIEDTKKEEFSASEVWDIQQRLATWMEASRKEETQVASGSGVRTSPNLPKVSLESAAPKSPSSCAMSEKVTGSLKNNAHVEEKPARSASGTNGATEGEPHSSSSPSVSEQGSAMDDCEASHKKGSIADLANSCNLYVATLPATFTDNDLFNLFSPFGPIVSCKVMCGRGGKLCKGYGFVLFQNENDANRAHRAMIGAIVNGNKIQVRKAQSSACAPAYLMKQLAQSSASAQVTSPPPSMMAPANLQATSLAHPSMFPPMPRGNEAMSYVVTQLPGQRPHNLLPATYPIPLQSADPHGAPLQYYTIPPQQFAPMVAPSQMAPVQQNLPVFLIPSVPQGCYSHVLALPNRVPTMQLHAGPGQSHPIYYMMPVE